MDSVSEIKIPKYKCHKEVWALKIKKVIKDLDAAKGENRETDGTVTLIFEDSRYSPKKMSYEYSKKHKPQSGGYYVVYKDGYESFSPAKAFEEGYTKID